MPVPKSLFTPQQLEVLDARIYAAAEDILASGKFPWLKTVNDIVVAGAEFMRALMDEPGGAEYIRQDVAELIRSLDLEYTATAAAVDGEKREG